LQYLGREQPDGADRQPVGAVIVLLILPDRLEIGSEDERRAIDEKDMVARTDGTVGLGHGASLAEAGGEGYRGGSEVLARGARVVGAGSYGDDLIVSPAVSANFP
jgi:hypothetical protein